MQSLELTVSPKSCAKKCCTPLGFAGERGIEERIQQFGGRFCFFLLVPTSLPCACSTPDPSCPSPGSWSHFCFGEPKKNQTHPPWKMQRRKKRGSTASEARCACGSADPGPAMCTSEHVSTNNPVGITNGDNKIILLVVAMATCPLPAQLQYLDVTIAEVASQGSSSLC